MNNKSVISAPPSGVSGTRKAVSMIVLLVAVVVFGIELRAGLGQANSAKALAGISEDGIFKDLLLADAQLKLSFAPSESVIRETANEKVYQYRWMSILRPLIGQAQPELYLVSQPTNPPKAFAFYTDPDDAKSGFFGDAAAVSVETGAMIPAEMDAAADPFGIPDAVPSPSGTGGEVTPPVSEGGTATEP